MRGTNGLYQDIFQSPVPTLLLQVTAVRLAGTSRSEVALVSWLFRSFGDAALRLLRMEDKASPCQDADYAPTLPLANLSFSFNADGDRIGSTDSVTGTSKTYGYDQADELTSYSQAGGTGSVTATYGYNGNGLRMSKTVDGTTTKQVWYLAEGLPVIIQDGSTKEITGPGGLPIEQVGGDGTVFFYLQDQLGSTRGLTDAAGNIVATYSYDAYGNLTASSGTASTPFQYAGQYTDNESGLQYLRARYYDPQTAQFLTVDPLVGLTQQPYGYAGDNAVNYADPYGLWPWDNVGSFVQQNAGTIVVVGYVGAVGVAATCAFVTLGACVAVDVALGGALFGGGALVASTLLPPGEGLVPGDGLAVNGEGIEDCPFRNPEQVIESARQPYNSYVQQGARAIAKKLGKDSPAFRGVAPTQENAEAIIADILRNPARTVSGAHTYDIYNATGQGIRLEVGTNRFIGFLDASKASR